MGLLILGVAMWAAVHFFPVLAPTAAAAVARVLDNLPRALARVAGALDREEALAGARAAPALTGRAGGGLGAAFGAAAAAVVAFH